MRWQILRRCSAVLICAAFGGSASALTVYVSPAGNDAADGRQATRSGDSGPVASLSAALQKLRAGDRSGTEPDRIVMAPGDYLVSQPVRIGSQDSGDAGHKLVIEAQTPGTVTVTGGRPIGPFAANGAQWTAAAGSIRFDMLWVNGKRATRARSPNGGAFYTGGRNVNPPQPEKSPLAVTLPGNKENTRKLVLGDDARKELQRVAATTSGKLDGVNLFAMHSWTGSAQSVQSFDSESGVLTVSPDGRWPFFLFGQDQRFAFDNHPAMLDEAGEWWLSPAGELRYMPMPGQKPADTKAVAAGIPTVLNVVGTPDKPVANLVIKGIRFAHTSAPLSPFIDNQAAAEVPSAVVVEYANHLEFDDCAFEHLGGYGLWMRRGVTRSAVRRSLFEDLGAGGIRMGLANVGGTPADRTGENIITNNLVSDGGRAFPGAVGIWIGQSGMNRITNNELRRLTYSGISVGWTWGFGPSTAIKNVVEDNYLHDIGQGMLNDLGAIYTLGRTEGTQIRGNRIEDVKAFRKSAASAWGIYLDEGSSDVLVEKNVVLRTTGGGFNLHYGRDNTVRNNVFADGELGQVRRQKKGADSSMVFEHNVVVGDSDALQGEWNDSTDVKMRANAVFKKQSRATALSSARPAKSASSPDIDPGLACEAGHCKISDEAARSIGFSAFSTSSAGIRQRGQMLSH